MRALANSASSMLPSASRRATMCAPESAIDRTRAWDSATSAETPSSATESTRISSSSRPGGSTRRPLRRKLPSSSRITVGRREASKTYLPRRSRVPEVMRSAVESSVYVSNCASWIPVMESSPLLFSGVAVMLPVQASWVDGSSLASKW